jgi:hypothetical protein
METIQKNFPPFVFENGLSHHLRNPSDQGVEGGRPEGVAFSKQEEMRNSSAPFNDFRIIC